MDPETQKFLIESIAINKENNLLLKKLVRAEKFSTIYRIVYWSIIILSTLGAFYFIKPFLSNIVNIYTGAASGESNMQDVFKSVSNRQQMQDLFDNLK